MLTHEVHFSFKAPKVLSDRIEALRTKMAERNIGIEVGRAQVVRLVLERGIDAVERELADKR